MVMHKLEKAGTGYGIIFSGNKRILEMEHESPFTLMEQWVEKSLGMGIEDEALLHELLHMMKECEDKTGREAILEQIVIHVEQCELYK